MEVHNFTPLSGFGGGLLIGAAAVLLLWLNGRVAGISGIVAGIFSRPSPDVAWRAAFIAGMLTMAFGWMALRGATLPLVIESNYAELVLAGLLVGFGTRLGCGCTSGHGIVGIARFSRRSIAATLTFFMAGLLTATMLDRGL